MYSTFGLFSRPRRAVRGTSMATALVPKISFFTVPLAASITDFMAALPAGVNDTMTRAVSGAAALAGPHRMAAAAAMAHLPRVFAICLVIQISVNKIYIDAANSPVACNVFLKRLPAVVTAELV